MARVMTTIKRGTYEGTLIQDVKTNQFFAVVMQAGKEVKKGGPYYDQDEAEVELGTLIDNVWREAIPAKSPLARRY